MNGDTIWHRVKICCELKCVTPVHVGDGTFGKGDSGSSGQPVVPGTGGWPRKPEKKQDFEYARMARDTKGNPTIPASTLRGSLRALCSDSKLRKAIFGSDPGKKEKEMQAGLLRRLEAHLTEEGGIKTTLSRHVAIHPVTGAADAQKLYTFETVPPGTRFKLTFELRSENRGGEKLTTARVREFINLLHCWDGGPASALGGKTSRAFGRIALAGDGVEAYGISFENLKEWFTGKSAKNKKENQNPVDTLKALFKPLDISGVEGNEQRGEVAVRPGFELVLDNLSPFLVHDSRWVLDKPGKSEAPEKWLEQHRSGKKERVPPWFLQAVEGTSLSSEIDKIVQREDFLKHFLEKWNPKHKDKNIPELEYKEKELLKYLFDNLFLPDLEYARYARDNAGRPDDAGRPIIPATSLAGCFRQHARRILKTLAWIHLRGAPEQHKHKTADTVADELTGLLFGHETRQSLVGFGDGKLEGGEDTGDEETTGQEGTARFEHRQTFIAVDRFTGGVAEQKLYQVRAVRPGCRFRVSLHCRAQQDMELWMLGLLALLLRDLHHGKFTLGWGAHRGYGRFRLELGGETLERKIEELLSRWQKEKVAGGTAGAVVGWVKELNKKIETEIKEKDRPGKLSEAKGQTEGATS